jgi:tellurite resistance-related uncharacterized protein
VSEVEVMRGKLEYVTKTVEESYVKIKQYEDQIRKSYCKMEAMKGELEYAESAEEQSNALIKHLEDKL